MVQAVITRGSAPNDLTGEGAYYAFGKANDNFTELYRGKNDYCDPRDFGGWDITGSSGISSVLQLAINQAITANRQLLIPPGLYVLDAPVDYMPVIFGSLSMIGLGNYCWVHDNSFPPAAAQQPGAIFQANFNDRPAFFNSHGAKNCYLANFGIVGLNTITGTGTPTDVKANYVTGGSRDSRYSPYCGFLIDGFNTAGSVPPDGGYPGMSAFYKDNAVIGASTGHVLENISISGFVVGLGVELSGIVGGQGDTLTFYHCSIQTCDTNYACGSAQSKDVVFLAGNLSSGRELISCATYGNKAGCPPKMLGVNLQFAQRVFNLSTSEAPFTLRDCYLESVRTLGNFGTGGATVRGHCTIADMHFKLEAAVGPMPPIIFETFGLAKLDNLNISNNGSFPSNAPTTYNFANDISVPIEINSVTFNSWGPVGIPAIVGQTDAGCSAALRACLSYGVGGVGGYQQLSDSSVADVSSFTVNNRFAGTLRSTLFANGVNDILFKSANIKGTINAAVTGSAFTTRAVTFTGALSLGAVTATLNANWTDPSGWYDTLFSNGDTKRVLYALGATTAKWGSDGLSSSATTAATVQRVALSFTATDVTLLLLGDVLLWKMLPQGGSGSGRYVPGWVVTNIAGSVVTAQALYEINEYDTVAANGSSYAVVQPTWAPSGASLTCTTATSVNLTSVSPVATLKVGDWVSGAGLVANSRVVATDGAGNVTLNKATTASASGVVLSFGQFQTPTVTATW